MDRKWLIAGCLLLLGAPITQFSIEQYTALPIGPSRYLLILVCGIATAPIGLFIIEWRRDRPLAWWGRGLASLLIPIVSVTLFVGVVRLTPGPFGPIPGGPLAGPVIHEQRPDWRFTDELKYVHLQVGNRSLEMLCIRQGEHLYVGANFPDSKAWPHQVVLQPNVIVGVSGRLYPRHAVRIIDHETNRYLLQAMNEKYGLDVSLGTGVVRFFRLDPQ